MAKQKVDLRKVFQPSDSIVFLVIAIGLFIALFLDDMSVRLIGVCITVLGGVALFMIVSPRLTDLQIISPVRPSQTPDLGSRTVTDGQKTSQTFDGDAYRESFGTLDTEDTTFIDENQIDLFEGHGELTKKPAPLPQKYTATSTFPAVLPSGLLQDTESSVVILGKRSSSQKKTPPKLVSELREETRKALLDQDVPAPPPTIATPVVEATEPYASSMSVISGPVTEEIQLSDDVVVRPSRRKSESQPEPQLVDDAPQEIVQIREIVDEAFIEAEAQEIAEIAEVAEVAEEESVVNVVRETSRRSPAVALTTFVNDDADEDLSSQEPRREFDYLLNRVLMVIRSATNARTAAFLWVNSERQQLVVEAKITEAEAEFTSQRKIPMGYDAVSQIAREGRPEIITQISTSAELDLLPYYDKPAQTVSFIGVPVYYGGNVVGVLCADSLIEDAYSDITVGFFGQFTKLISGLVSSYTAKFDLMQSAATFDAIRKLNENLGGAPTSAQQIAKALFSTVIQLMDISRIGVVSFDTTNARWSITDARSAAEDGYRSNVGVSVDLATSAVGHSISSASTVTHDNTYNGVRVILNEPSLEVGQFVAVPICTSEESYGAMFFENLEGTLSQQDIALAEALGTQAGSLFEQLRTVEGLQGSALLDHATGVLNTQGFEMRIREEFSRAVDYNMPLTLCMVHLDPSRATTAQREHAILHVLRLVRAQTREYDVIARVAEDALAVGLIGYRLQEAQNWTETMRREIASSPVDVEGKRLSFTVSIGLSQAEPRDEWDDLIAHANAALDVSKRSGNKVTVFA